MRRLLLGLTLLVSFFVLTPIVQISAQSFNPFGRVCDAATAQTTTCQQNGQADPVTGNQGILYKTVRILSFVVGVAAVIMMIIGGLKYITSNGDSNSITSAKNTVLYALIGIVIFLLSQAIVIFVLSRI